MNNQIIHLFSPKHDTKISGGCNQNHMCVSGGQEEYLQEIPLKSFVLFSRTNKNVMEDAMNQCAHEKVNKRIWERGNWTCKCLLEGQRESLWSLIGTKMRPLHTPRKRVQSGKSRYAATESGYARKRSLMTALSIMISWDQTFQNLNSSEEEKVRRYWIWVRQEALDDDGLLHHDNLKACKPWDQYNPVLICEEHF